MHAHDNEQYVVKDFVEIVGTRREKPVHFLDRFGRDSVIVRRLETGYR